MPPAMEFRILGSLEVRKNGIPITIGSPRQQSLLAVLALEANHVVPVSRLIDTIWNNNPPTTARSQVQICISSLRKVLSSSDADDIILTRAPGYTLSVPSEMVDALQFERLVAEGRAMSEDGSPTGGVEKLRAALDLWRGEAATGIESQVVEIAAIRLNEQRLTVLEECIELEIQLGNHTELAGELAALVAENPLREKLRAHQMLVLYRTGRQAEALDVYRSGRRLFVEDLGLEPGDELQALQRAILESDPSLSPGDSGMVSPAAPPPPPPTVAIVPRQLPADIADFTGRQGISEQIREFLTRALKEDDSARPMPVAVLSGMGGVGKTALALHVAHLLEGDFTDGQLFLEMRGDGTQPASAEYVLGRCLRALGVPPSALPGSRAESAEMYRSLLATRRVLVVIDDAATAAQVAPLLPGGKNCAVIVTSRRRLPGIVGAHFFEVELFTPTAAVVSLAAMLDGRQPVVSEDDRASIADLCGYLPLALRIVAAKLLEHPHWSVAELLTRLADEKNCAAELETDDVGITASIQVSFDSLSPQASSLFLRLSLLGASDFAPWVCAPLIDKSFEEASGLLDQLVTYRLVETRSRADSPARFHLHGLVRVFAMSRLETMQTAQDRMAALNRLFRCWLFLVTEAHNREYGGDFMALHGSSEYWQLSGPVVDHLLQSPLDWFRREHRALISAVKAAAESGEHELCWDLVTSAVTLFEADSLLEDWRHTHEMALEAVRQAGNARGEAALMCSLGELALVEQKIDTARSLLIQAVYTFDELKDLHGRAIAESHMAYGERLRGDYNSAINRYTRAMEDLREVEDHVAASWALCGLAQAHIDREEYETAERLLNEALQLCGELGVRRIQAQASYRLAELYLVRGSLERADETFQSVLDLVRSGNDRIGETHALHGRGVALMRMGKYNAAVDNLTPALEMARELNNRLLEGRVLLSLGQIEASRGLIYSANNRLSVALRIFRQIGAVVWQVRVLTEIGRLHMSAVRVPAAREAYREALKLAESTGTKLGDSLRDDLIILDNMS